ncbi:MAG: gamma-glutamyltransferase family protein [Steroidobacteraceae bacterium]
MKGSLPVSVSGVRKWLAGACLCPVLAAAAPPVPTACDLPSPLPYCSAVRGDRSEGWHAQTRSEVMAQHGMVAASQPLAAQAGLEILKSGGNAIDAAVATAAVLNVVEPMMTGVGGDLFAIVYIAKEHRLYALNASGMAPSGATIEHFRQLGFVADSKNPGPGSGMPEFGILPVTVPGAVWGWDALLKRFGTRNFKQVLEPAKRYARDGFPVSERIASDWLLPEAVKGGDGAMAPDPDSVRAWYVDGEPPAAGTLFRNPDLAHTFELLQQRGAAAFYRGPVARAIVAKSTALGGTMTLEDLASYRGEWGQPAMTHYHGYEVYELPPPSQDWATLLMLNVLEACVPKWSPGQTLATEGPLSPAYWHALIEAKKLAYADLFRFNGDPDFITVPLGRLLSKDYAASLCSRVDPRKATNIGAPGAGYSDGDTVVLATADAQGNMVSWVSSNYEEFGSGLTVPGYGFILHDRGALFSLDPSSPNAIAPHKRPYNTLSAGFVMRNGAPYMTITLMGGDMQAQGHAEALINMFDLGANVQAASDMARFRHLQVSNALLLESPLYERVGAALSAMGHDVHSVDGATMGGLQAIVVEPAAAGANGSATRVYRGGSDHRKDGEAVGW